MNTPPLRPIPVGYTGGMDADDAHGWGLDLIYRGAYGLAWREVELSRYHRDQVHAPDPAKGLATLIQRITHELGKTDERWAGSAGGERGRSATEEVAARRSDRPAIRSPRQPAEVPDPQPDEPYPQAAGDRDEA